MTYRLLIDYEALDFLASLKKPAQRLIHQRQADSRLPFGLG